MRPSLKQYVNALRELAGRGDPITSQALVDLLDIQDSENSSALKIAGGWISTLRRYGMLKAVKGQKVQGPERQLQVYELTDWGMRYKAGRAKQQLRVAANPKE
jgi:hypothetical protein